MMVAERTRRSKEKACMLLSLLLVSFIGGIDSLSVTVRDLECVYEYVLSDGDIVSGNFVVLDHHTFWGASQNGIDFTATSPGGNVVKSFKGTSGDKFIFKASRAGMYKFCFHNPYSSLETVSFHIHVGHIPNGHNLAKDEHLDPISVQIANLREALESVTSEQKYLKAQDTRHRHTNESTRNRVILYTVGEYIMLGIASALQVIHIRRLFSKSVAYNRV